MALDTLELEQLARRLAELSPDDRLQVLSAASAMPESEIWWANFEPPIQVSVATLEKVAEEMDQPPPPASALVDAFRRWNIGR